MTDDRPPYAKAPGDRPRACTEPPWQYILDRKAREREALAARVPQEVRKVVKLTKSADDEPDDDPNSNILR